LSIQLLNCVTTDHVIKEGKLLLVREDNRRVDFEVLTLTQYFDFAPFRAAYLKEVLRL